ncbi:MAG: polysaccharide pyruvyl transferase family protein, partial [Vulcanimicrobiota bacterium]
VTMMAELLDSYIEENNAEVFIFPFQETQDKKVCEALKNKMKFGARIIERKYSLPQMMGLMGEMDLIVGMRLHSLIFALNLGIPVLGLSYDPKVANLMQMLNLPWLSIEGFTREELVNTMAKVYLDRGIIREKLPGRVQLLKNKAKCNIKLLKEVLDK